MPINYEFEPEDMNKENLSIAEMNGKKLDCFRKVCATVLQIPRPSRPEGAEAKKDDATKTSNYPYKFEWNI